MTTVPKDPLGSPPEPPATGKANPMTGKGQVNIGPPITGNSPPGAYQADPTTGLGKGNSATPEATIKPFTSD